LDRKYLHFNFFQVNHKTIKGIIFKTHNSGLSDKIVNLILENGERKSYLAKSSRKGTSRKLSSLEIGNLVKVKFVEGYNIGIISDVKIENEFIHWKKDYKAMIYLQFICEIIDKFVHENIEEQALYDTLVSVLNYKA
jgi:DNA repair protein RecO